MTVNAQPEAELFDPRDFGLPVTEAEDLSSELRTLVARVHGLIDAVAHTEADPAELEAASQAAAALTERLNVARRGVGAMVHRAVPGGGNEYGTLTNIVAGDTNPAAPPLVLERSAEGVRGEVTLNGIYQGPPGFVHGGWIAALLDQALGSAAAISATPGLTANLSVDYRRPTPLFTPLEITARVTRTERRKVFVSGEIRTSGDVTAEGTAVMVQPVLSELKS